MANRKNAISGQFIAFPVETVESPAFRALGFSAVRALFRISLELAHHGGNDNGKLPVTFDDFERYGINRHGIAPALAELEALGFIAITERGKMARGAEYRRPNKFLLTTRPELEGVGRERCRWRRFKTLEDTEAAASAARANASKHKSAKGEKKKPPVSKAHWKPVRETHHSDQIASEESSPLSRGGKLTTIYISGRDGLDDGSASPPGLTPTGLPLMVVDNAPTPADDLHLEVRTDRSAGLKLVWRAPVVTELFGDEARMRRAQVERAEKERAEIIAMRASTSAAVAI